MNQRTRKKLALAAVLLVVLTLLGLWSWRQADERHLSAIWRDLAATEQIRPGVFDPESVAHLPEVVQRFFGFAIKPGTPLYTVVEISMHGQFSLGSKEQPGYVPMKACQILAPPHGFAWTVTAGTGPTAIAGSDAAFPGGSWTRFWMLGLLPVARGGSTTDHARSSFGRYMAEAVFWSPASLLPSNSVTWQVKGPDSATVTVTHQNIIQAFDLQLDQQGRPLVVRFQRWSNANKDKEHRLQPFGGYMSEFQEFNGYMLPTQVNAGNHFGTKEYFPFYKAIIDDIRFVRADGANRCAQ